MASRAGKSVGRNVPRKEGVEKVSGAAIYATDVVLPKTSGRELAIEHRYGQGVERASFRAEWVRVEPASDDGSLVEVSGEGRHTRVGRYVRPEWRAQLAQELRLALRLRS